MTLDPRAALSGETHAIGALVGGDPDAWGPLLDHVLDDPAPAPAFAAALWGAWPELDAWSRAITQGLGRSEKVSTVAKGRRVLVPWLLASVREAFEPSHDAALDARLLDLRSGGRDDGGFAEARALVAELELRGGAPRAPAAPAASTPEGALLTSLFGAPPAAPRSRLAEATQLAAKAAFVVRDHDAAERYAKRAVQLHEASGDDASANAARRLLVGALLHQRRWDEAFALADEAMRGRGPMFGGGGVTTLVTSSDPQVAALDELQTIATWASLSVPEWVRAIGALTEVFADDPARERFERRYARGLDRLLEAKRPLDELEVVIRQLRERGHLRAARVAARRGARAHPDHAWILSVHGNLAQQTGALEEAGESFLLLAAHLEDTAEADDAPMFLARAAQCEADPSRQAALFREAREAAPDDPRVALLEAQTLASRDPDAALPRARAVFEALAADPRSLTETHEGHAAAELLLDLLLARQDPEAIRVQQRLVDAKRSLFGDCPALWLELHNLGGVEAQLGRRAEGRARVEAALRSLEGAFGPHHPHAQTCRRTLARIDEDQPS